MKLRGWYLSDVGSKRDHNEDSFLCNDALSLFAVADGMGGHLGGERASRMAVDIVEQEIESARGEGLAERAKGQAQTPEAPALTVLRGAIVLADRLIYETALADPNLSGMGTTFTGLLFEDGHIHLGHVGDSRAFLYRDGRARQLTEDHSWIQEQVRAGLITADEARESRFRNIITRSVGFEPVVNPDMMTIPVQAGDCFLICSDGLSNYLSCDEIGQVLTGCYYADAPRVFIDAANERGGDDNITCVVVYAANEND